MKTWSLNEGHNYIFGCGSKGFLIFESESTCVQWEVLCAKQGKICLAINSWRSLRQHVITCHYNMG